VPEGETSADGSGRDRCVRRPRRIVRRRRDMDGYRPRRLQGGCLLASMAADAAAALRGRRRTL